MADNDELQLTLIEADENGIMTLSNNVAEIYGKIVEQQSKADANMDAFREGLLKAMIKFNISSCKVGNITCSQVIPKNTYVFDVEKFMLGESEDVVVAFTSVDRTETFDLDKFKAENPELYKKYTTVNETPVVDTKKLEKTLPSIYRKYTTEIVSDKPIRLMIKEDKK